MNCSWQLIKRIMSQNIYPNFNRVGVPLEFVRELPTVNLTSAPTEPVVLECELSRKPRENVRWLKNGKPLPSRLPSHVKVDEKSGSTVHSVTLDKVTDDDLGEYTVQVEGISSTGKLDMQGRLSLHYQLMIYLSVFRKQEYGMNFYRLQLLLHSVYRISSRTQSS